MDILMQFMYSTRLRGTTIFINTAYYIQKIIVIKLHCMKSLFIRWTIYYITSNKHYVTRYSLHRYKKH